MKKIILNKGKTIKIIEEADKHNGYIVCLDKKEATRIFIVAGKNKKKINFPITFDDFRNKRFSGFGCKCFHIDNADLLLQCMSEIPIQTISLTK